MRLAKVRASNPYPQCGDRLVEVAAQRLKTILSFYGQIYLAAGSGDLDGVMDMVWHGFTVGRL